MSLSLFNILNYPLSILPITITFCVQVSKTVFRCHLKCWYKKKYFCISIFKNYLAKKFCNHYCPLPVYVVYICLQAGVALSRIGKFLRSSELDPDNKASNPSEGSSYPYFTVLITELISNVS